MDKKLVKVNFNLEEMYMKESLLMDNSMEKENIFLLNQERFMKEISLRIICMVEEQ